jgi:hypothetical protein
MCFVLVVILRWFATGAANHLLLRAHNLLTRTSIDDLSVEKLRPPGRSRAERLVTP